jgi:ketosteroid isomerase-like protein
VQILAGGGAAVISYVRLTQVVKDGRHETVATQETRVWERAEGGGNDWVCVHREFISWFGEPEGGV